MNRAVGSFVAFVCALALLLGAVGWWLGAPLVDLALDSERRQAPYFVLYMNDASAPGTPFDVESGQTWEQAFAQLLAAQNVSVLWQTSQVAVAAGEVADEWQQVSLGRFPSGAELVRTVTSGSYRQLAEGAPGGARMVLGLGSQAPGGPASELLLVAAAIPEDAANPLPGALQPALLAGGRVLLDAPAVVLEGTTPLNRVLLLGFDDAAALDDWLLQAATETELALLRSRVQALTIWRFMNVRS